ncbi:MAG: hypothetical protein ACYCS7_06655 [Acidimicrobiales bacterium]
MRDTALALYVWQKALLVSVKDRIIKDESGEGVISAAIAVLIMAFLGVGLWVAFKLTLSDATKNVNSQVSKIGQ